VGRPARPAVRAARAQPPRAPPACAVAVDGRTDNELFPTAHRYESLSHRRQGSDCPRTLTGEGRRHGPHRQRRGRIDFDPVALSCAIARPAPTPRSRSQPRSAPGNGHHRCGVDRAASPQHNAGVGRPRRPVSGSARRWALRCLTGAVADYLELCPRTVRSSRDPGPRPRDGSLDDLGDTVEEPLTAPLVERTFQRNRSGIEVIRAAGSGARSSAAPYVML
jgi:hypothetical protein